MSDLRTKLIQLHKKSTAGFCFDCDAEWPCPTLDLVFEDYADEAEAGHDPERYGESNV